MINIQTKELDIHLELGCADACQFLSFVLQSVTCELEEGGLWSQTPGFSPTLL